MIYEMSQSLRKSGLCRRDMKKDFGMLINGLLEVYGEQCEERMKVSSTLGRISATLLANFGPNGFCIKDLVAQDDSTEEMLLKVLNHLVGQKVWRTADDR